MKQSLLAVTLACGLAVPTLLADDARERSGGSSSTSSASDRAPSSSGSGHSSGVSSGSSSSSSSDHYSAPSAAESRHPRPGTGHGSNGNYRSNGRSGGYYYPYSYGGYSYYGYPYYYGYWSYDPYYARPYYPRFRSAQDYGALRVLVEPSNTRVYVDGYYAGEADDFDGIFQRLNVSPGRHEITLKLEGRRTHRVRLYVPVDHTIKLHHDMVKGDGEDPVDDQVGPADRVDEEKSEHDGGRYTERARPRRDADDDDREQAGVGTLRLHVTPEDASVYVDGRFRGSSRQMDDLLMPAGRHHVEVVRPGYKTYDQDVDVAQDQPTNVRVALDKL